MDSFFSKLAAKRRFSIPLEIDLSQTNECHIVISCILGDRQEARLIVDTGASKSVFDKTILAPYIQAIDKTKYIQDLNVAWIKPAEIAMESIQEDDDQIVSAGVNGDPIDLDFFLLKKFQIGKLFFEDFPIVCIDLTNVNQIFAKMNRKPIAGLLGSDFLLQYRAIIDYRSRKISFDSCFA